MPPLRDRSEDIPLLAWHFAKKYALRMKRPVEKIPIERMEALVHYDWPGNIRELQNVMERAVILSSDGILRPSPLNEMKPTGIFARQEGGTLREADRECILNALKEADWVIGGAGGAASQLGVKRTTLLYKMQRLGISRSENDGILNCAAGRFLWADSTVRPIPRSLRISTRVLQTNSPVSSKTRSLTPLRIPKTGPIRKVSQTTDRLLTFACP